MATVAGRGKTELFTARGKPVHLATKVVHACAATNEKNFERQHQTLAWSGNPCELFARGRMAQVICRQGIMTWAEHKPDEGATFLFSLPQSSSNNIVGEQR